MIRSGGFLRRQPGRTPLGAGGMYQRAATLERAMRRLSRFLWQPAEHGKFNGKSGEKRGFGREEDGAGLSGGHVRLRRRSSAIFAWGCFRYFAGSARGVSGLAITIRRIMIRRGAGRPVTPSKVDSAQAGADEGSPRGASERHCPLHRLSNRLAPVRSLSPEAKLLLRFGGRGLG